MSNLYSHAGVSSLNGEYKVRFCNDAFRTKVLQKNGHKNIDIIELSEPMTKEDAVAFLVRIDFATKNGTTNKAVQAALEAAADKRGLTAPKAKVSKPVAKATKTPVAKTTKAPAKAVQKEPAVAVQTEAKAIEAIKAELGEALM
jgi:hypothetical protein